MTIQTWMREREAEMLALLSELCAVPSISGTPECERALMLVLQRAQEMGFEARHGKGRYGVVTMGKGDKRLGMIAHMDVVPAGEGWQYPPFGLTRVGEYVIGRGSQDNKGAAVLALYIMRYLREQNVPLGGALELILGTSEEDGMQDMQDYLANEVPPDLTLVLDCDYPVCYGQKGHYNGTICVPVSSSVIRASGGAVPNMVPAQACITLLDERLQEHLLTATGVASHAASPQQGVNAVRKLLHLLLNGDFPIDALTRHSIAELAEVLVDDAGAAFDLNRSDAVFGATTMVGSVFSVEDGWLTLSLDMRFPACLSAQTVVQAVDCYAVKHGMQVRKVACSDAFYINPEDAQVQCMMEVYRECTGDARPAFVMGGGTYSRALPRAVTFGPSMPHALDHVGQVLPKGHGGAHQPDEALHIPSYLESAGIIGTAVERLSWKL
ncbi:MAG: M20/M25/M40 family metallo-hydrolase [Clostridia bacterium]